MIYAKLVSDAYEITSVQKAAKFENGYVTNILFRGVSRGTLPNFPVVAEFSHTNGESFDIEIVLHKTTHERYDSIPIEIR